MSLQDIVGKPPADHIMPWEEVKHVIESDRPELLCRTPEVLKVYTAHITSVLARYGTVDRYLLAEVLHWPEPSPLEPEPYILRRNDFGYAIDPSIDHFLIWSPQPLRAERVAEIVEKEFESKRFEAVYFVNPAKLQSVKNISHVHVFVRLREGAVVQELAGSA
ncbi:hypothetical protein BC937DRAFT_87541 [Endogone sp. FLAS-F59071]|nr:hypothetical protein BC937DRAFT_87541 [Endogone sp. FLAS-F59071]|eukprot:RUS22730.1 hypothetical protein BC937DRAFT_87541 [Endogone sp. FLAS-F59071]